MSECSTSRGDGEVPGVPGHVGSSSTTVPPGARCGLLQVVKASQWRSDVILGDDD